MYIPVLSNPVLEFQGILAIILLPCWNRWAGAFTLPFCPGGSEFTEVGGGKGFKCLLKHWFFCKKYVIAQLFYFCITYITKKISEP